MRAAPGTENKGGSHLADLLGPRVLVTGELRVLVNEVGQSRTGRPARRRHLVEDSELSVLHCPPFSCGSLEPSCCRGSPQSSRGLPVTAGKAKLC